MNLLDGKTKGELDFINEFTRTLLVQWCDYQVRYGHIHPGDDLESPIYLEYAQSKGWVSSDGTRVLAMGFKAAAAFLRR